MLSQVLCLFVVPASALVLLPVGEMGSSGVTAPQVRLPKDFVIASGVSSVGDAEKAFELAVEGARSLGYPDVSIQMFARRVPAGPTEKKKPPEAKSASSLAQTTEKTGWKWPWESDKEEPKKEEPKKTETGNEEYVIVSDRGNDGKLISENQKLQLLRELSKRAYAEVAEREAESLFNCVRCLLQEGGIFSRGGVIDRPVAPVLQVQAEPQGLEMAEAFDPEAFDIGAPLPGGVSRTTTFCQDGKCTRTEEYTDPNWVDGGAPQPSQRLQHPVQVLVQAD